MVIGMPEALGLVPVVAASGVAVGHRMGVSRHRKGLEGLRTAIEGYLDGLERR